MRNRTLQGGLSLPELVVGVSIVALGFLVMTTAPSPSLDAAQVDGLANELRGEIVKARQLAVARHEVVALGFPSSSPVTQSCYRLEGWSPRMDTVFEFSKAYPQAQLILGHYAVVGGNWSPGGLLDSLPDGGFDRDKWEDPTPSDSKLIFTPGGSCLSNLPLLQGAYQVVCAKAAKAVSGSFLGASSFELQVVQKPVALRILPSGNVEIQKGLPYSAPGVVGPVGSGTWAVAPVVSPSPAGVPVVSAVNLSPGKPLFDVSYDASVTTGDANQVEILVKADMAAKLTGYANVTSASGIRTLVDGQALAWDAGVAKFRWSFGFKGEDQAPVGTVWNMNLAISSSDGAIVTWPADDVLRFQKIRKQKVVWASPRWGAAELMVSEGDGSRATRLTDTPEAEAGPVWSPDGKRILYHSNFGGAVRLYTCAADGGGKRLVLDEAALGGEDVAAWGSCWSGTGTQVAVLDRSMVRWWRVNADGSTPYLFYAGSAATGRLSWHPSDKWVVGTDGSAIVAADSTLFGASVPLLVEAGASLVDPIFSPNGSQVAYIRNGDLWMANFAPAGLTNLVQLSNTAGAESRPVWSPDGRRILVEATTQGKFVVYDVVSGMSQDFLAHPGSDFCPSWGAQEPPPGGG